ncbi:TonB-dependent receptor, partial [Escherichia coli]|nr:TonB-dependent receptor [Escherichia coli]
EDYYKNLPGGILEAFGKFFRKDMKVYLYPYKDPESHEVLDSDNLKVNENLKELYKYFKHNNRIVDIKTYNPEYSEIYSREILVKIANCETCWECQLPEGVADMIKERGMFGYKEAIALKEF